MEARELEGCSRSELIERAEALSVSRASVLTRAELIDEIVRRTVKDPGERRIARGLLGLARDLVARVVERGLHLPDAAAMIRGPAKGEWKSVARPPIATVTLAEIYAAQGHKGRALSVLDEVLDVEPEHEAASFLRDRIATAPEMPPVLPPEKEPEEEPVAPDAGDEIVVTSLDERTARFHWAVREASIDDLRPAGGQIVLRILTVTPSWTGPVLDSRDVELGERAGDLVVDDLPERAIVRAAVGFRSTDVFEPFSVAEEPGLGSSNADGDAVPHAPWGGLGVSTVAIRPSALVVS